MTSTLQLKMFMHALETPPPSSQHFDSIDLGIFGVDDEPLAFNSWEIAPMRCSRVVKDRIGSGSISTGQKY